MYFNFRHFTVMMWQSENSGIINLVFQTKIKFNLEKNIELMKSINALREEKFGITSIPRLIYMSDESDYNKTALLAVFDRKTSELVKINAVSVRTGQNRINKLREVYKSITASSVSTYEMNNRPLKEAVNN